jgi:hypothetical protein
MKEKCSSGKAYPTYPEKGMPQKRVVILENPDNFDAFLFLRNQEEVLCIATTPEVSYLLEKNHELYIPVDNYIGSDEITRRGMSAFETIDRLCRSVDKQLQGEHEILREFSLRPAGDNFQYVKVLYDVLIITTRRVQAILETEQPSVVITFSRQAGSVIPKDVPFHPGENLFDIVMKGIPWGCQHISVDGSSHKLKGGAGSMGVPRMISVKNHIRTTLPGIYSLAHVLQRSGICGGLDFIKTALFRARRRKRVLCISGYGYDWMNVLNDLAATDFSIIYTQNDGIRRERKPYRISVPPSVIKEACICEGTDFSGLFLERMVRELEASLEEAYEEAPRIKKMLERSSPCAILCSTKSNFSDHITAHIAHNTGIPVVSWQHGAAGFFQYPLQKYVELDDSTTHLVWGPGVRDQIAKEFPGTAAMVVPVGSIMLINEFTRGNDKRTDAILYVTTNYFHNSLYIGYAHKIQDIHFWETQKEIIKQLGAISRDTVIKLHPGFTQCAHFSDYISDQGFTNIRLITNNPSFTSLLHESEIIIIDFPSTTLLQAIASRKTVFVLIRFLELTNTAKQLLKKRAYCADDTREFLEMIEAYLQGKPISQRPDPDNSEFLEMYGISSRDGLVSERVITVLSDCCFR